MARCHFCGKGIFQNKQNFCPQFFYILFNSVLLNFNMILLSNATWIELCTVQKLNFILSLYTQFSHKKTLYAEYHCNEYLAPKLHNGPFQRMHISHHRHCILKRCNAWIPHWWDTEFVMMHYFHQIDYINLYQYVCMLSMPNCVKIKW